MNEILWAIALIIPLLAVLVLYAAYRIGRVNCEKISHIAALFLGFSFLYFILAVKNIHFIEVPVQLSLVSQGSFSLSNNQIYLVATGYLLFLMNILYSGLTLPDDDRCHLYFELVLFSLTGFLGFISSTGLFQKYIFLEFMSLPIYTLVAFRYSDSDSALAGKNYLIMGTTATLFFLAGISLVYYRTGSLRTEFLLNDDHVIPLIAVVFFCFAFLVKSGVFPAHTWLAPAHSSTPSGNSAVLSGIIIESIFLVGFDLISPVIGEQMPYASLIICLGCANMIIGNILAFRESHTKRMLAYSSVAQMGYILFAYGLYVNFADLMIYQMVIYFILSHAALKSLAFISHGYIKSDFGDRIFPRILFGISLLGLAALPPASVFLLKWGLLERAFSSSNRFIQVSGVIFLVNGIFSCAYYLPRFLAELTDMKFGKVKRKPIFAHARFWLLDGSLILLLGGLLWLTIALLLAENPFPYVSKY